MKIHFYKNWRAKRAQAELEARSRKHGFILRRIPVSFFRISSTPTLSKEDLTYLKINYVDGSTLTSSIEKKPNAES